MSGKPGLKPFIEFLYKQQNNRKQKFQGSSSCGTGVHSESAGSALTGPVFTPPLSPVLMGGGSVLFV